MKSIILCYILLSYVCIRSESTASFHRSDCLLACYSHNITEEHKRIIGQGFSWYEIVQDSSILPPSDCICIENYKWQFMKSSLPCYRKLNDSDNGNSSVLLTEKPKHCYCFPNEAAEEIDLLEGEFSCFSLRNTNILSKSSIYYESYTETVPDSNCLCFTPLSYTDPDIFANVSSCIRSNNTEAGIQADTCIKPQIKEKLRSIVDIHIRIAMKDNFYRMFNTDETSSTCFCIPRGILAELKVLYSRMHFKENNSTVSAMFDSECMCVPPRIPYLISGLISLYPCFTPFIANITDITLPPNCLCFQHETQSLYQRLVIEIPCLKLLKIYDHQIPDTPSQCFCFPALSESNQEILDEYKDCLTNSSCNTSNLEIQLVAAAREKSTFTLEKAKEDVFNAKFIETLIAPLSNCVCFPLNTNLTLKNMHFVSRRLSSYEPTRNVIREATSVTPALNCTCYPPELYRELDNLSCLSFFYSNTTDLKTVPKTRRYKTTPLRDYCACFPADAKRDDYNFRKFIEQQQCFKYSESNASSVKQENCVCEHWWKQHEVSALSFTCRDGYLDVGGECIPVDVDTED